MWRGEDPPPGEKFRTAFRLNGWDVRPDMPVYLAGLSPGMLRLAGEIADGVILWLCNPNYIRDVVVPTVREGREKAKMLERSGLDPDEGATDEFLSLLGAIGSADEALAAARRYAEAGTTSPCIGGIPGADFDATLAALAKSLD